ncbi:MAG: glycosyltransferase family 39 protein [Vicinamibacterales bacterium]|nr:glycosyltransferase family 39 protein [Vicinamibacterales bacterium]
MLDTDRPSARWRACVWALAGYVAAWALMTYPQVLSWRQVGDLGDPLGKIWQLAWVAHALIRNPAHLFDGNIFYPERLTLAYSDTMLVPSFLGAPFIWMGAPPALVFNVLLASGFVASGITMFVLVRRLTGSGGAAWVAGLAFAFLPYRFNHYSHLELQLTMWMPLALWALHRTVDHGRWRDGLLTGGCIGLQFLSSLYYGVFFVVMLLPIGLALVLTSRQPLKRVGVLAAGAVLAMAMVLPVVLTHASARTQVGQRERSEVLHYSAWMSDYVRPNVGNRTYPSLAEWDGEGERRLFPGFVLMGLAVAGLWPLRSRARIAYVLGTAVAIDASRGLHGTVYTILWDYLAPFGGFRVPARFGMLAGLGLAVLAGWGVWRVCRLAGGPRLRLALTAVISLAILAESRSFPLPLGSIGRWTPEVYRWLATQPDVTVLELPVEDRADFGYMYFSTLHMRPIVNGQSGFFPPWYRDLVRFAGTFPTDEGLSFLRDRGVTHVVVHRRLFGRDQYDELTGRLAQRQDLRLVKSFPLESAVYRIVR